MKNIKTNLPLIFFSILPISIILGSAISLVNTMLLSLSFIYFYFTKNDIKIIDRKPIILLIILSLYLVFNSLTSVDMMSGIYRNIGFVRFILFFLMINYLFCLDKKNNNIFKVWTTIFFIVLIEKSFPCFSEIILS